ncbi:unnamed protein product, partial [Polarella glacialis]
VVHDPEHPNLLRLSEAGLPAWAIVMPQYTGLYRRSMRIVVAAVLLLLSFVSMLLGFYDLYRRIPAVRLLLKQVLGPLSSRLEELVVVRLSVLLGWMLPYSAIFQRAYGALRVLLDGAKQVAGGMVWCLSSFAALTSSAISPLLDVLTQPLTGASCALRAVVEGIVATTRGTCWAVARLFGASRSGSAAVAQVSASGLLQAEFTMARQAFMSIYNCTCLLGAKVAKHQASMRLSFARWSIRTRRRLVEAAKRNPIFTVVLTLALAWLLRPPGV